jgi:hypothetical protein
MPEGQPVPNQGQELARMWDGLVAGDVEPTPDVCGQQGEDHEAQRPSLLGRLRLDGLPEGRIDVAQNISTHLTCLHVWPLTMAQSAELPMLYRAISSLRWPYLPVYSARIAATCKSVSFAKLIAEPRACLPLVSRSSALSVFEPMNRWAGLTQARRSHLWSTH